jgi:hypothetical protein
MAEVDITTLTLPFSGQVSSTGTAFSVTQGGTTFSSIAGQFENISTTSLGNAFRATHKGYGDALVGRNLGLGRAGLFFTNRLENTMPALEVRSSGRGGMSGLPAALEVWATNPNSVVPAVNLATSGKGAAVNVNHKGTAGAIATFQSGGVNKASISRTGRGYFNGGTQNNGADVAETFEVEGTVGEYQPGDVLVISNRSERKLERSDQPYSTRVVGVYATKPGVLLSERDIEASLDDMVPLGVIGVIPTKVSADNGAIRPGDLLVTAGRPGHAMLADPERLHVGMVLGKALENFSGPGTGLIRVLVNVK